MSEAGPLRGDVTLRFARGDRAWSVQLVMEGPAYDSLLSQWQSGETEVVAVDTRGRVRRYRSEEILAVSWWSQRAKGTGERATELDLKPEKEN
jgi:hypothetical protein